MAHRPMDAEFAERLIDTIILPLATGRPADAAAGEQALLADAR
ncbi:hypothetical protein [Cellulomonas pakistanensis]|nr:hypothetical protein [Cellulomonas pakistanensis]